MTEVESRSGNSDFLSWPPGNEALIPRRQGGTIFGKEQAQTAQITVRYKSMQIMLAEDLGGWLLAGSVLFGGLGFSVLALGALIPAWKGDRVFTLLLAAPAFVLGVIVTGWLVHGYVGRAPADPSYNPTPDFVMDWIFMAAPALVTSLLAVTVLWNKRRRRM